MKTITRLASMAAIAGAMALVPPAFAADYGKAAGSKADAMDTDADGAISSAEHEAGAKALFAKMDADSDGLVTAVEMDAYNATKKDVGGISGTSSAERIKRLDTNADGALSAGEYESAARTSFNEMDADKDGKVTAEELSAARARIMGGGASTSGSPSTPATTGSSSQGTTSEGATSQGSSDFSSTDSSATGGSTSSTDPSKTTSPQDSPPSDSTSTTEQQQTQ